MAPNSQVNHQQNGLERKEIRNSPKMLEYECRHLEFAPFFFQSTIPMSVAQKWHVYLIKLFSPICFYLLHIDHSQSLWLLFIYLLQCSTQIGVRQMGTLWKSVKWTQWTLWLVANSLVTVLLYRLKLSPSPSSRVTVSRVTGSSSSRTIKRKRMEAGEVPEVEIGEEQLLVSEEATASGAVTISPTDMDGNAVTLNNDTEQARLLALFDLTSA